MKVRTLTVLLPSFKPLKNHVIRTFLQLLQARVFSRKFLSTLGHVTPEQQD